MVLGCYRKATLGMARSGTDSDMMLSMFVRWAGARGSTQELVSGCVGPVGTLPARGT